MKRKFTLLIFLISPLLFLSSSLLAFTPNVQDTCGINDFCETAIPIENVIADEGFICVDGCNMDATPEVFNTSCQIGLYPTVWYSINIYDASLMNIQVSSNDIETPTITVFYQLSDCSDMILIPLTQSKLSCIIGTNGVAEAIGTDIGSNATYLIAVSSFDTTGGTFSLCVSAISNASNCVSNRSIEITYRTEDGPLEGPFYPGETIGVCMNVNSYTAAGNGCQWFQGLVPVFGNGWDPGSFDPYGQPLIATINGNPIGVQNNGLYGAATWDWFTDVDYHFDDPFRQIGDFDGNGSVDMCNILYDSDCPNLGGIDGGCCGPCWGTPPGSILPGGWFAYGINGSCTTPGPPVRVDWGDGNTCGGGMGPWNFCFDLVIRGYPDCLGDETTSDLKIGFFTFADGETGSWTGQGSDCANDQPAIITLPLICAQGMDLGVEFAEDRCADDEFEYIIYEPGINYWTWSIFPSPAVKPSPRTGENGYVITDTLLNPTQEPIEITYYFTGYRNGSPVIVNKQVRFTIIPEIRSSLPGVVYVCEKDTDSLIISALPLSGGQAPYAFQWSPGGETTSSAQLIPPFQNGTISVHISDTIGCSYQKEIMIKVKPCHLDTIVSDDDSNETQTPDDGPIGNGKIVAPAAHQIAKAYTIDNSLKVYPIPATETIHVEWNRDMDDATTLIVYDIRGHMMYQSSLSKTEREGHRTQINVRDYVDGVYLVILQTKQTILTSRLLKM